MNVVSHQPPDPRATSHYLSNIVVYATERS
jgi:hypothetical protein